MRVLAVLALVFLLPPSVPAARADRPVHTLTLKADRYRATLGESLTLTVKLAKRQGKPVEVNALRLARNSVTLRVRCDWRLHTVTRIYGTVVRDPEGEHAVRDAPPPRATLRRQPSSQFFIAATKNGSISRFSRSGARSNACLMLSRKRLRMIQPPRHTRAISP